MVSKYHLTIIQEVYNQVGKHTLCTAQNVSEYCNGYII